MNARDELYAFATVAFKETGVPPIVHENVTKLLDAYRSEVQANAALVVVTSCPDHQPSDADGSWIDCHCPAADELRRMAATSEKGVAAGLSRLFERLGPPADEADVPPCTHCKGDGADPEDPGDYDSAVHMHNPGTWAPCPQCNGTGRQPTP